MCNLRQACPSACPSLHIIIAVFNKHWNELVVVVIVIIINVSTEQLTKKKKKNQVQNRDEVVNSIQHRML